MPADCESQARETVTVEVEVPPEVEGEARRRANETGADLRTILFDYFVFNHRFVFED